MRKHVLIDCDPGIDDTIALLMAFASDKLNIVGLTTVFGNNSVDLTTKNTLILNETFNLRTNVYKGATKALYMPNKNFGDFHGKNGMGNVEFATPTNKEHDEYAWDAIYQEAKKYNGELSIVTLGPLTNIAIALFKYEDLGQYVKEIIMMAGTTTVGNERPFSEANVVSDPHAMQVVLNSGIPLTMIGLNATETTRMTEEEHDLLIDKKEDILPEIRGMLRHYKNIQNTLGSPGMVIHDAAAIFAVIDPESAESEIFNVEVELTNNAMFGRTIVDIRRHSKLPKNCRVVERIDKDNYLKTLNETLMWKGNQ
jgi:pyrimidine-specific ribonucleoside hydrolase